MQEETSSNSAAVPTAAPVTHSEFKSGLNKTIGHFFLDANFAVRGTYKLFFNIWVMFYLVGPLILVPIFALRWHTWGPLLAIIASYAGSFVTAKTSNRGAVGGLLFCLIIGAWVMTALHTPFGIRAWLSAGLHNILVFNCLWAMWGSFWFSMADGAQEDYALQAVLESPELYDEAIANNKLQVFRFQDMGAEIAQRLANAQTNS
jgi:phosphotransferase system  glucose/maltose/N-acetylglucosamine-specific IIC component